MFAPKPGKELQPIKANGNEEPALDNERMALCHISGLIEPFPYLHEDTGAFFAL